VPSITRRTFRISPPSILSLDWLFEFHCTIRINEIQHVTIDIKEDMTGHTRFLTIHRGEMWRLLLFTWHKCHVLAFKHVLEQNTQDAMTSNLARLEKILV